MIRTLDDIHNSWANVFCGDGCASVKLAESREQVVGFIGWEAVIEPVDLQVFVMMMGLALETSHRSFDVLQ